MNPFRFIAVIALLFASFSVLAVEQLPPPENVAAPPEDAIEHSEGLFYVVLEPGTGQTATRRFVKTISSSWTSADGVTRYNGEESGPAVGEPEAVAEMLPGWATAVRSTPIGERRLWWISAEQMSPGWEGLEPGAYTVDLKVLGDEDPLSPPDDVAQPPDSAFNTESGLAYVVLHSGGGEQKPGPTDIVTVHYSGWTIDGDMFDSSVLRDEPADFPVNRLIAGMTEGLQLMTVGDRFRFWIPSELAYGENPRPGAPKGMLVFDVEMIAVKPGEAEKPE